jgi:hypothetical protein
MRMSMDRNTIQDTIKQARQFVVAGQALIERLDAEEHDRSWGSPESGTLRRRSMDLTRKLAELRKYA